MSTQTQTGVRSATAPAGSSTAETVVGFAVMGCLVAGAVGILKALEMENGLDVCLCLLGSVSAFGLVYYMYFGRR